MIYTDADINIDVQGKTVLINTVKPEPIQNVEDSVFEKVGLAATATSALLFETLKAQGSNILINNSEEGFSSQIIPRSENDGLDFQWKGKEGNEAELKEISSKISDAINSPVKTEESSVPEKKPEPKSEFPADSYMVKHLERKP